MAVSDTQLIQELEELIEALDRRVPRIETAGESAIANEAATLRARAVARLADVGGHAAPAGAKRTSDPG